jgi:hypothetical protein
MQIRFALAVMIVAATGAGALTPPAAAQAHQHGPNAAAADTRQLVELPAAMRLHTLASMRDHLVSLQEINEAMSRNDFETAADVAERRLGMTSLEAHGAAHIAPYMPKPMQDIGTEMHRSASRFAVATQTASVSNDARPAMAALGAVMRQCVACHAAYRLH